MSYYDVTLGAVFEEYLTQGYSVLLQAEGDEKPEWYVRHLTRERGGKTHHRVKIQPLIDSEAKHAPLANEPFRVIARAVCRIEVNDKPAKQVTLVLPEMYLYNREDRERRRLLKKSRVQAHKRNVILTVVAVVLGILGLFMVPYILSSVAEYRHKKKMQRRDPDYELYTPSRFKR